MTAVEQHLADLGVELPSVPRPLAAYLPALRVDGWVYTAGQLPFVGGELPVTGIVGADVTVEQATEAAAHCALNALAAIAGVADLDDIAQIVKITGFVAATPDFTDHPLVLNGASEFFGTVFGDVGYHARSAVGVASLPMGAPVEVEVVARLRD